jgi:hypothetical protein
MKGWSARLREHRSGPPPFLRQGKRLRALRRERVHLKVDYGANLRRGPLQ